MTTFKDVFDGAKAVRFTDDGQSCIVWHGGPQFQIATIEGGSITNPSVKMLTDEQGNPVDRETAVESMEEMLEDMQW